MRDVSALSTSENQVHLIVSPTAGQAGKFTATLDGVVLVAGTKTPFLDAARALIAAGTHPATTITMAHASSSVVALRARLGTAAGMTVDEAGTPRFKRWKPFSRGAVTAPMRSPGAAHAKLPVHGERAPGTGVGVM